MLSYLGSASNLIGCGLGGGAAVAVLATGIAGPLWPAVVAASYGIGAAVGTLVPARSASMNLGMGNPDAAELLDAVSEARRRPVPSELRAAVKDVLDTIEQIAPRWASVGANPNVAHDVTATLTDYLPTTVDAFTNIPGYLRTRRDLASGESPLDDALDQLGVLGKRMTAIREAAFADDLQRLAAQGQFLDQRFRERGQLDLDA